MIKKLRFLPLAVSNYASQLLHQPGKFASKVSLRLFERPLPVQFTLQSEDRWVNFDEPVVCSPSGSKCRSFDGRVLHVLTNSLPYSKGGYAVRSHAILQAQLEAGMSPSAITRLGYPVNVGRIPRDTYEEVDGVSYMRALPTIFPLQFENAIRCQANIIAKEAKRIDATVLHTTTPWPNAVATSQAAARLGIPWVYEVRGEPEATWLANRPQESSTGENWYFRRSRAKEDEAMMSAAAVVAISQTSASSLVERGITSPISVVPNSIDADWPSKKIPREDARRVVGLPPGTYVGAVSSLVGYEGFDSLILSLHHLPEDVSALLVGDGEAKDFLRELARKEGLSDRVFLVGHQEGNPLAAWYSTYDVFVMPRVKSIVTENVTPIKSLQAQALGIPIVTTDLPALREVTQGRAQYVPPNNPEELAKAIEKARKLPSRSEPSLPTWDQSAQEYLRIYESLFPN